MSDLMDVRPENHDWLHEVGAAPDVGLPPPVMPSPTAPPAAPVAGNVVTVGSMVTTLPSIVLTGGPINLASSPSAFLATSAILTTSTTAASLAASATASSDGSSSSSSSSTSSSSSSSDLTTKLVAIIVPILVVLAVVPIAYILYIRRRNKREISNRRHSTPDPSDEGPKKPVMLRRSSQEKEFSLPAASLVPNDRDSTSTLGISEKHSYFTNVRPGSSGEPKRLSARPSSELEHVPLNQRPGPLPPSLAAPAFQMGESWPLPAAPIQPTYDPHIPSKKPFPSVLNRSLPIAPPSGPLPEAPTGLQLQAQSQPHLLDPRASSVAYGIPPLPPNPESPPARRDNTRDSQVSDLSYRSNSNRRVRRSVDAMSMVSEMSRKRRSTRDEDAMSVVSAFTPEEEAEMSRRVEHPR